MDKSLLRYAEMFRLHFPTSRKHGTVSTERTAWSDVQYHPNFTEKMNLAEEEKVMSFSGGPTPSSVQFSHSVVSDSLQPHGLQHARPPCPSPTPGVYSNSCPLSWWCHPTISSSVAPFSCLQSVPTSGSFAISWLFTSGGQSIGASASASALPMNIQGWFPSGLTGDLCAVLGTLRSLF